MNRLIGQLPALQAALSLHGASLPVPMASPADVGALVRAIKRKATFAQMHMALLTGIDWDRIDGVGRRTTGAAEPECLTVRLSEASLLIEHPGAVIDHVYLAFDGIAPLLPI